jgi:hypothetical protein
MFSIVYIENKETPLNRINIVIMKNIQKELLLFQIEIYQVNNLDIFSPKFNLNIFIFDNLLNSISVLNINLQIKITKSINSRYIDIIDKYK